MILADRFHRTGLLARGLAEIAPRGGLEGWRWIFIIEGLLVSILTLYTILVICDDPISLTRAINDRLFFAVL